MLVILSLSSCAIRQGKAGARPKLSAPEARADLDLLVSALRASHPSLYWYSRPSLVDSGFQMLRNSLTDSISQIRFRYGLAASVALLRCGHTSVRFGDVFARQLGRYKGPVFPVQVAILHPDTMVYIGHLSGRDSVLRRGDRILEINGMNTRQFIRTFIPYISTDGYGLPFRLQNISGSFGGMYRSLLGLDSQYQIRYADSVGRINSVVLRNYVLSADTAAHKRNKVAGQPVTPTRRELRKQQRFRLLRMDMDTARQLAYLRIGSFSTSGSRSFYRRSFRKMKQLNTQKLIIDLRNNLGGNLELSNLLLKYTSRRPFRIADSVYAISRQLQPGRYLYPKFFFRMSLWFRTRRQSDGFYHFRRYEKHAFTLRRKNRYTGHVWVLQNGFSYSASTVYAHVMKGQPGVQIAGTESGGGGYGNSAIHIPTVVLPHSGLRVSLPLFRLVFAHPGSKGAGVLPDIELHPTAASVRRQEDIVLEQARALLLH